MGGGGSAFPAPTPGISLSLSRFLLCGGGLRKVRVPSSLSTEGRKQPFQLRCDFFFLCLFKISPPPATARGICSPGSRRLQPGDTAAVRLAVASIESFSPPAAAITAGQPKLVTHWHQLLLLRSLLLLPPPPPFLFPTAAAGCAARATSPIPGRERGGPEKRLEKLDDARLAGKRLHGARPGWREAQRPSFRLLQRKEAAPACCSPAGRSVAAGACSQPASQPASVCRLGFAAAMGLVAVGGGGRCLVRQARAGGGM